MISIAVVEDDLEYQKQLLQYIEQYKKEHKIQWQSGRFFKRFELFGGL